MLITTICKVVYGGSNTELEWLRGRPQQVPRRVTQRALCKHATVCLSLSTGLIIVTHLQRCTLRHLNNFISTRRV